MMPPMPPWMSGALPMLIQGPSERPRSSAPVRVNKAMEFLSLLARKQQKSAAVSEHNIEVIIPDPLCPEEEATRDSALVMLGKYFDGKLEADYWEQKRENDDEPVGRLIGCIGCNPHNPSPECILCNGSGKILVTPVSSGSPIPSSTVIMRQDRPTEEDSDDDDEGDEQDEQGDGVPRPFS